MRTVYVFGLPVEVPNHVDIDLRAAVWEPRHFEYRASSGGLAYHFTFSADDAPAWVADRLRACVRLVSGGVEPDPADADTPHVVGG